MLRDFDEKGFTERAEQGDAEAMITLGLAYQLGWGDEDPEENVDLEKALFWLTKAKQQRKNQGCYYLGCLFYDHLEELEKALEQWEEGEKRGDINCISRLEFHYTFNSELGSRSDAEKAAFYGERGALLGCLPMMMNTANNYAAGRGVKKNPELACSWWTSYIKRGGKNPSAAFRSLGKAYLGGKGVKRNFGLGLYLSLRGWVLDREYEWEKRESDLLIRIGKKHYEEQTEGLWQSPEPKLAFEEGGREANDKR